MAEGRHFMNPSMGKHMGSPAGEKAGDVDEKSGQHHPPQIHIHSHSKGHTVHVMHASGKHEKFEHEHGDSEGVAGHIHEHLGGSVGQDHGFSSGDEMEDELGAGPGV